ncbi:ISL3 family transposase [bacterium M21]|nr:ISL3 family transposase [bacterium M21]
MHIKTILNRRHPLKRFVYEDSKMTTDSELIVTIRPRKNSKPLCSRCGLRSPGYDTLEERLFQFVPILGMPVFFSYSMRRVECSGCGIVVEQVPWADGKHRNCKVFFAFLASWAEDLPWKRVAERFQTSWQTVYKGVDWVVSYGLKHRDLEGVTAIGVDEVQYRKGQNYFTVVYQLDSHCRRLLWVGKDRTEEAFAIFFSDMERLLPGFCASIQFVCSDMWKAYLNAIRTAIPQALHVLDRFHIRGKFSDALDKVRRQEVARLKAEGKDPVLGKSRWCFLKNPKNLTQNQKVRLKDLMQMNLRTVKAYILTDEFEHFWTYNSVTWAKKFLKNWTFRTMRSKIEPMKSVARMLRKHEELILNWFRAKKEINNGITEGLNSNVKLAFRKARGFRSVDIAKVALFHQMGQLPKPEFTCQLW